MRQSATSEERFREENCGEKMEAHTGPDVVGLHAIEETKGRSVAEGLGERRERIKAL